MRRELLSGHTIVVMEDHDDSLRYVELFLRHAGAKLVAARNSIEGLEAIKIHRPTLILSDLQIPGGDGFAFLRELRSSGRDEDGIVPVIAMSGVVSSADGRRILDAGFNAYLQKPFTPDRLLEAIRSVLND
jgi:diguanylate cyclase